jgi:hypothetical protein
MPTITSALSPYPPVLYYNNKYQTPKGDYMKKYIGLLAIALTIGLIAVSFYAALSGAFFQPSFWALYLVIIIADLLCIRYLKK